MKRPACRVSIDVGRLSASMAERASRADAVLAGRVLTDTEPYVPARTGAFSARAYAAGGRVVYPAPFAARLYGGTDFTFTKTLHPLARAAWFEAAKAQRLPDWVEQYGKELTP